MNPPELARPDYAREVHEAKKHVERNPGTYPETKQERYRREFYDDHPGLLPGARRRRRDDDELLPTS